jgi:hypothetical protein
MREIRMSGSVGAPPGDRRGYPTVRTEVRVLAEGVGGRFGGDDAVEKEHRARADAERLVDVVVGEDDRDPFARELGEEAPERGGPRRVDAGEGLLKEVELRDVIDRVSKVLSHVLRHEPWLYGG